MSEIIHSLWIGDNLSSLELLTLNSFTQSGYEFNLWVYDIDLPVPHNIVKKNANDIIPESEVFYYKNASKYGHGKGSLAGFSDIFRYQLLYKYGGIWVDMDITCLQPLDISSDHFFRHHHTFGLVGNVLKAPQNSPLMLWCYERSITQINADNINWTLPIEILKQGVKQFKLEGFIQNISNEDKWPVVARMLRKNKKIPAHWKVIHWMNEEFRHLDIQKNKAVKDSVYEQFLKKYTVAYSVYTKEEENDLWWKLSKLNYTLINLRARWDWLIQKFR